MPAHKFFSTTSNKPNPKQLNSFRNVGIVRSVQNLKSAAKESLRMRGISNPTRQQVLMEEAKLLR